MKHEIIITANIDGKDFQGMFLMGESNEGKAPDEAYSYDNCIRTVTMIARSVELTILTALANSADPEYEKYKQFSQKTEEE